MKKISFLSLFILALTCASQTLVAEQTPQTTAELVATSSDDQFFLLDDDTAWFVITGAQEEFAELAAHEEDLAAFVVGDKVVVSKEDVTPFFKLTHAINNAELVALKVDAIVRHTVEDKPLDDIIELRNGLFLRTSDAFTEAVNGASSVTLAVLNQDLTYQGQSYHCDMQWMLTTYRNWFFQKVQEDVVKGQITPAEGALENLEPLNTIVSVSHDFKTIQLGDGTTYVNADFSGNDEEKHPYIEPWHKGDQVEIGAPYDEIIPITNLSTGTKMLFLKPSFEVNSKVIEHKRITVKNLHYPNGISYLWVELENGAIVQMSPAYQTHFSVGDNVIYTFLNANYVPQTEGVATVVKYHNLFNPSNNFDYCNDYSLSMSAFLTNTSSITSGAPRR